MGNTLKDSSFVTEEFSNAKKASDYAGRKNKLAQLGSNKFLLVRQLAVLAFWLKFQKFLTNYLLTAGRRGYGNFGWYFDYQ